jgi:hypothetical protein
LLVHTPVVSPNFNEGKTMMMMMMIESIFFALIFLVPETVPGILKISTQ